MKYYLVLCVVLVLIGFSVQGVSGDTGQITVSVSRLGDGILIANGEDHATITVNVVDTISNDPMPNLPVTFTLNDPTLGSLSITDATTDSNGNANTVFTAGNKFGQAVVTVEIDYPDTEPQHMVIKLTGYPDTVTISGSVDWLVAGQTTTSSLITVQAFNQSRPIPNLPVEFSVLNPTMGTVTVSNGITDSDGKATTSFKPSTISGVAYVQAVVKFTDEDITKTEPCVHEQKIDHAAPVASSVWHNAPSQILVGDNTTITVAYFDQYGNPIDNLRYSEYLNLWVNSVSTPSPNPPLETPAGLWNGTEYVHDLTVVLDELGVASFDMQADTQIGLNKITVDPQFDGASKTIDIEGVAGIPVRIEYDISTHAPPDPYPNIPADGQSVFTILYTLKDESNNPVGNSYFWMNTTLGERTKLKTNSSGMVKTTYGPKIRTDIINLTMTAVDPIPGGSFASNAATVEITSLEPTQMSLTANPQYVPSWDVQGERTASIKAVVMDCYGNPVKDETVVFQIIPDWGDEYQLDEYKPQWRDYEGLTIELPTERPDEDSVDAYALAEFRPGYFEGYGYPQKDDSCTIIAEWGGLPPQSVTINWTNVPFLSISTDVSPAVVSWNETLTVNIKVIGDGYALRPKPVDIVLVLDTSTSMRYDIDSNSGYENERIEAAIDAAKNFIGNLNPERDRVGLVTFNTVATNRQTLTNNFISVNQTIDNQIYHMAAGTALRDGLHLGISELENNGRSDAINAVILLTDGAWNLEGTPLGKGTGWPINNTQFTFQASASATPPYLNDYRYYDGLGGNLTGYDVQICTDCRRYDRWGNCVDCRRYGTTTYYKCLDGENTNQNMSRYATANNVRMYNIFFSVAPVEIVNTTFQTMADANEGLYEYAPTAERLTEIFEDIAGLLREEAGVGIQMDLPFNDVKVATTTSDWTVEGKEVFDYIPYTDVQKFWFTNGTMIYHYPDIDNTTDWDAGEIEFDIGTMKLNQEWESTFHLKVLNSTWNVGRITLFDQNDIIQFNDGKEWYTLSLPTTFITCIGGQSETQIATEEAGYDITSITNESTMITVTFDRLFIVNGTPQDEWYRTWYENYFIDIPGYRSKTKIGSRVIPPTVPKTGTYTFDLGPYLPPGQSSVDFNFYVEGTDKTIDAVNRKRSNLRMDPGKIYILLK